MYWIILKLTRTKCIALFFDIGVNFNLRKKFLCRLYNRHIQANKGDVLEKADKSKKASRARS